MNWQIKITLLLVSVLTLSLGVRQVQCLHAVASAGAQMAEPHAGAWIELSPTPGSETGEVDQVMAFESSQAQQAAPSAAEPASGLITEGIPSAEERHAILDMVNRGPPILSGDVGQVGEGPVPGTESDLGHREGRDNILGGVNRGAPLLPERDKEAGEGPVLGTESDLEQREEQDTVLDGVSRGGPELSDNDGEVGEGPEPGMESDVEQRSSLVGLLAQLIETLRNWWQELFT